MQLHQIHQPNTTFDLSVSPIHKINVRTFGNPEGIPVIFLHGGPGGGANTDNSKFFDPDKYLTILFDQRGCGSSTPFASLKENTTWDLVEDIEKIRMHLQIDKWIVFGGSWGSTLALSYGITHPERCLGFVLRGIFLGTQAEVDHLYIDGASRQFPEAFEIFLQPVANSTKNLIEKYYQLLTSSDESKQIEAAQAWSQWEGTISRLIPDKQVVLEMGDAKFAAAFARIECHYFQNNCFFETPDFLMENLQKITHLPCSITQGRYDIVCSPKIAWRLHSAWPDSRLDMIKDAGHSASEPGIATSLVDGLEWVSSRI